MRRKRDRRLKLLYAFIMLCALLSLLFFVLPSITVWQQGAGAREPFPIGVDPQNKKIIEKPAADNYFHGQAGPLQAAAQGAGGFFAALARVISGTHLYQMAAVTGAVPDVVTIQPGWRKEQVAAAFGDALNWNTNTEKMFTDLPPVSNQDLNDGTVPPGDYSIADGTSVLEVQTNVRQRFNDVILSRYTPAIQKVVPLDEGLTIASILERETSDPDEMRIISGIIWNRIFSGMKLQMDSTLQYAKATGHSGVWWPQVVPKDKYIDSPYNTYQNDGLPPAPIAEPSVAAVLAALNPKKTTCLYYFHDSRGNFHCSDTYEGHVALLKKYFGQGK